jgi:hypothetical protein
LYALKLYKEEIEPSFFDGLTFEEFQNKDPLSNINKNLTKE